MGSSASASATASASASAALYPTLPSPPRPKNGRQADSQQMPFPSSSSMSMSESETRQGAGQGPFRFGSSPILFDDRPSGSRAAPGPGPVQGVIGLSSSSSGSSSPPASQLPAGRPHPHPGSQSGPTSDPIFRARPKRTYICPETLALSEESVAPVHVDRQASAGIGSGDRRRINDGERGERGAGATGTTPLVSGDAGKASTGARGMASGARKGRPHGAAMRRLPDSFHFRVPKFNSFAQGAKRAKSSWSRKQAPASDAAEEALLRPYTFREPVSRLADIPGLPKVHEGNVAMDGVAPGPEEEEKGKAKSVDTKPLLKPPSLAYTRNIDEAEDLLNCLQGPLGLDLEWNFSRRSGQTYKTALVQLCSTNLIIVMQISSMRQLPPSLVRILSDPSIIKTGVAIRNDAMKLQRDFDLRARNVVELSTLAKLVDPVRWAGRNTLISLKDLCKVYLGRSLKKDATRVSDWTKVPLQPIQIEYAASDVFAGLEILRFLLSHLSATQQAIASDSPLPVASDWPMNVKGATSASASTSTSASASASKPTTRYEVAEKEEAAALAVFLRDEPAFAPVPTPATTATTTATTTTARSSSLQHPTISARLTLPSSQLQALALSASDLKLEMDSAEAARKAKGEREGNRKRQKEEKARREEVALAALRDVQDQSGRSSFSSVGPGEGEGKGKGEGKGEGSGGWLYRQGTESSKLAPDDDAFADVPVPSTSTSGPGRSRGPTKPTCTSTSKALPPGEAEGEADAEPPSSRPRPLKSSERAFHLWRNKGLSFSQVASMMRAPVPLKLGTVASYVLSNLVVADRRRKMRTQRQDRAVDDGDGESESDSELDDSERDRLRAEFGGGGGGGSKGGKPKPKGKDELASVRRVYRHYLQKHGVLPSPAPSVDGSASGSGSGSGSGSEMEG